MKTWTKPRLINPNISVKNSPFNAVVSRYRDAQIEFTQVANEKQNFCNFVLDFKKIIDRWK